MTVHDDLLTAPAVDGIVDRRQYLPDLARGKRVLHLGCVDEHLTAARAGTGDLLHQELARTATELTGVDISHDGLRTVEQFVPGRYIQGDVERLGDLELPEVDLVVAAELIEHLGAPGRFLSELRAYLGRTPARAVITTPNAYSWRHFATMSLRRREVVHPDHRMLYSPATLLRSLDGAGLDVERLLVHTWRDHRTRRAAVAGTLDRAILRWNPLLAVGLVAEVRPRPSTPSTSA